MTRLSCTSGATLESQVVPVLGAQRTDVWEWRGHKIRYGSAGKIDGNHPSIVMLHGFGSSADTWRNQYQDLSAAGFRVFGVDLLGFGLSDKPKGTTYSIDLWAEMVHDFIKDVAGGHAVLMGNSIGSLVSCTVARDQPEAARGLVLCNCAAGMNSSFLVTSERTSPTGKIIFGAVFGLLKALLSLELFASWVFGKVKSRETVSNVLKNVYVNKDSVDADLVKSILDPAENPNALEAFVKIFTGDPGSAPDTFMHEVSQPMLVVWGDTDPMTPMDAGYGRYFTQELYSSRADTQLKVVNAGHCPQDDGPAAREVNRAVIAWLATLKK